MLLLGAGKMYTGLKRLYTFERNTRCWHYHRDGRHIEIFFSSHGHKVKCKVSPTSVAAELYSSQFAPLISTWFRMTVHRNRQPRSFQDLCFSNQVWRQRASCRQERSTWYIQKAAVWERRVLFAISTDRLSSLDRCASTRHVCRTPLWSCEKLIQIRPSINGAEKRRKVKFNLLLSFSFVFFLDNSTLSSGCNAWSSQSERKSLSSLRFTHLLSAKVHPSLRSSIKANVQSVQNAWPPQPKQERLSASRLRCITRSTAYR